MNEEHLQSLLERQKITEEQFAEMQKYLEYDVEPPPSYGAALDYPPQYLGDSETWMSEIHGITIWYIDDDWTDEDGNSFWVQNGVWHKYDNSQMMVFDPAQSTWTPYRDYTGLNFERNPYWQEECWFAVIHGIDVIWDDRVWQDEDDNEYWSVGGEWHAIRGGILCKYLASEGDWLPYRPFVPKEDAQYDPDGRPTWRDEQWRAKVGGLNIYWDGEIWRDEKENELWLDDEGWNRHRQNTFSTWSAQHQQWLPERNYNNNGLQEDVLYDESKNLWMTRIYGIQIKWEETIWRDSRGGSYVWSNGIWSRTSSGYLYYYNSKTRQWTPKYDGDNFDRQPVMSGGTLITRIGNMPVLWDMIDATWKGESNGFIYTYTNGKWYQDNLIGTIQVHEDDEWRPTNPSDLSHHNSPSKQTFKILLDIR